MAAALLLGVLALQAASVASDTAYVRRSTSTRAEAVAGVGGSKGGSVWLSCWEVSQNPTVDDEHPKLFSGCTLLPTTIIVM